MTTSDEIRSLAAEMKAAGDPMPETLRARFIAVRTMLFERGIYDPVLGRLDSATVPPATAAEVAEHLGAIAATPL